MQLLDYQEPPNYEFRLNTNQDARSSMNLELNNLLQSVSSEDKEKIKADLDGFRQLFDRFVTEPGPSVIWEKIEKLPSDSVSFYLNSNLNLLRISNKKLQIRHHKDLSSCNQMSTGEIKEMLDKLVVIKLNGALATPLGCRSRKYLKAMK